MNPLRHGTELEVHVGKTPDAILPMFSVLAANGIGVLARCMFSDRNGTVLLLLTDDHLKAQSVFGTGGYECRAEGVLWAEYPEYHPGSMAQLCHRLNLAGIDVQRMYVSTYNGQGCVAVLKTSDNQAACRYVNEQSLQSAA